MKKIRVDTVSSHLTHDRAYREFPIVKIVSDIQNCRAKIRQDGRGRDYVIVSAWHVGIHAKKLVGEFLHVDIVTAWKIDND